MSGQLSWVLLLSAVGWLWYSVEPPGESNSTPSTIPGRICLEKQPAREDDTNQIQQAIDRLSRQGGGVVLFSAGHYRHRGLIGRPNVRLEGVQRTAVILDFFPSKGDGIRFESDPDNFSISRMTLTSSGRSKGWAVKADRGVHRSLRVDNCVLRGFENGILISNGINCSLRQCKIGHTFPKSPRGIGIQFGDGNEAGGNGMTIEDCYLNSLEKGIVTHAQACLISRPILEICDVGIETHGTTTLVAPWYDRTTRTAHLDVQPNTLGGGSSGTGALVLGYGSAEQKIRFASKTEKMRSIVLPERLDFGRKKETDVPLGIQLGPVIIDREGVIHGRGFQQLPR